MRNASLYILTACLLFAATDAHAAELSIRERAELRAALRAKPDITAVRVTRKSVTIQMPTARSRRNITNAQRLLRRATETRTPTRTRTPLRPVRTTIRTNTQETPVTVGDPRMAIVELTNIERAKEGLSALTYNTLLEQSAQLHAQDMSTRNYFSHTTPEGDDYSVRIRGSGYGKLSIQTCGCSSYFVSFGENLAQGYSDPAETVEAWMNSPGHRKNILSPEFGEIGVGIAGDIWVQNFGKIETEQ